MVPHRLVARRGPGACVRPGIRARIGAVAGSRRMQPGPPHLRGRYRIASPVVPIPRTARGRLLDGAGRGVSRPAPGVRGRPPSAGSPAMFAFLAFLPAASSAVVQLYHPQDVVSLGLAVGGLAQVLRRRWVAAGLLFGVAVLTKQFAVLVLVPAAFAAPDARARRRLLVPAAAAFVAGLAPFFLAAPRATWDNLSGSSGGGAVHRCRRCSPSSGQPEIGGLVRGARRTGRVRSRRRRVGPPPVRPVAPRPAAARRAPRSCASGAASCSSPCSSPTTCWPPP